MVANLSLINQAMCVQNVHIILSIPCIFESSKIERARVKVLMHSPCFDFAQSLPFVSVFVELL